MGGRFGLETYQGFAYCAVKHPMFSFHIQQLKRASGTNFSLFANARIQKTWKVLQYGLSTVVATIGIEAHLPC